MQIPVFDSRDPRYKAPFGAVPCNTKLSFTVRPSAAEGFTSCVLLVFREFEGRHEEVPLHPAGAEGDCFLFTCEYEAPAQPELIWYSFRFSRAGGSLLLLDNGGLNWQLTVYDASLPTPDWFGSGVTYQIFPDRFRRTGLPESAGLLGNRRIHQSWDEAMELPEDQEGLPGRDFFGGTLAGITEKLDYLKGLSVSTLYLCPIFESESNHRYNTGDYEKIDPMLGTEEDFRRLCAEAKKRGIRVMLDGVFNHTGSNSRYFNAGGAYPSPGAAQSQDSPYYSWYTFQSWPEEYDAWWGIKTLPAVNEENPEYVQFIIEGNNSVIRRWLRAGADAWRLDVADELPDEFIARIRRAMMEEKPDSFLLGEVWEDGSNKISYSKRRKYLLGRETHGLMNYPFRVAALSYLQGFGSEEKPYTARDFMEAMEIIRENYPPAAFYSGMNMLTTHDTSRALTVLGGPRPAPETRRERAAYRMTHEEREHGKRILKLGVLLLYAFPGSPTVFYGDEAGIEGYEDPMNRGTYPWGREDQELLEYYRTIGKIRAARAALQKGTLRWLYAEGPVLAFARDWSGETSAVVLNAGKNAVELSIPWSGDFAADILGGHRLAVLDGQIKLSLPPFGGVLLSNTT